MLKMDKTMKEKLDLIVKIQMKTLLLQLNCYLINTCYKC